MACDITAMNELPKPIALDGVYEYEVDFAALPAAASRFLESLTIRVAWVTPPDLRDRGLVGHLGPERNYNLLAVSTEYLSTADLLILCKRCDCIHSGTKRRIRG